MTQRDYVKTKRDLNVPGRSPWYTLLVRLLAYTLVAVSHIAGYLAVALMFTASWLLNAGDALETTSYRLRLIPHKRRIRFPDLHGG